jgi:nucleoside-diphosphate-sugar epimerase
MNIFLTGGSGFIGSRVLHNLIDNGHRVAGLARSDSSAAKLEQAGATVIRGELTDVETLRAAARDADAVIHCGFVHDFANFMKSMQTDREAIAAMLDGLASSASDVKAFINTSGTATMTPGKLAIETDAPADKNPRVQAEHLTLAAASRGIKSLVIRLPETVHGPETHGFVPMLFDLAKKTGVAAFIGDGANRWPAVHRDDAAKLYAMAVDKLADGTIAPGGALHATAEEGVAFKEIARAIANKLGLGEPRSMPPEHFGWFAMFAGIDNPASSAITRQRTGWSPTGPKLLDDIASPAYDPLV